MWLPGHSLPTSAVLYIPSPLGGEWGSELSMLASESSAEKGGPSLPMFPAFETLVARCSKSRGGVPVLRVVIFHKSVLSRGSYQRLPVWKLLPEA